MELLGMWMKLLVFKIRRESERRVELVCSR